MTNSLGWGGVQSVPRRARGTMVRFLLPLVAAAALALAAPAAAEPAQPFQGDETAAFFGFLGAASALVFACAGAAYGTAKSGVGIASMGVMRPELVMKARALAQPARPAPVT